MSNDFVFAANLEDIPNPGKLVVEVDSCVVVLVRYNTHVYCVSDVCTHDGGTLGDGELEDHCLVCPRHGAKFDVRTGAATCMPATEATEVHEVRCDGNRVLVKINQ